ncbi:MAG: arginine--tRNA ligase [Campylobacterota bacterium]
MKRRVLQTLREYIDGDIVLEKPKDKNFGHFATPIAFSLAKKLRKNPMIIAQELADDIAKSELFEKVEAIKGYVNLKLSQEFLNEYATWVLDNKEEFGKDSGGESILLEFVSANPTGPLHIGHARGAVWGDIFARVGTHLGYEIVKEYYLNDAGKQVLLLAVSIDCAAKEILGIDFQRPDEYYRGEYIKDVATEAIDTYGSDFFNAQTDLQALRQWGVAKMLEVIKRDLADAKIEFDYFMSEKQLFQRWDDTLAKLQKADATYEKEGKLWLHSTLKGDELDRVVVREDGNPTYLAGDIIYHDDKFSREYDRYINIWGADHHGYIARVKAAVSYLGHDEDKLEIILSQMVSLLKGGTPYKMSKRAGNFILMRDVTQEIGSDMLRFMFVSKKCDTHLEFDIDTITAQDSSNPVFYINYAHARVHSLFKKAQKNFHDVKDADFTNIDIEGMDLLFLALLLPEVLKDAFAHRQLQKITDYLYELATAMHSYYNKNKVVASENEQSLLKLFAVCATTVNSGLELLGIEAQKSM